MPAPPWPHGEYGSTSMALVMSYHGALMSSCHRSIVKEFLPHLFRNLAVNLKLPRDEIVWACWTVMTDNRSVPVC